MTKNYFTKEQALKIALNTNVPFSSDDTQYIFNTAQIREMMNLAVETAIGEPIGAINTKSNSICRWHFHFLHEDYVHRFNPLYSVKELEN